MKLSARTRLLNKFREILFKNSVAESILRIFTKGHPTESMVGRLVPNHYQYAKPSLRIIKFGTTTLELDLSDLMEWHYFFGFCDPTIETLKSLCHPGQCIVDVGSNIGAVLTSLAARVGPSGQAFGFEPNPVQAKKCRLLAEALNQDWVEIESSALGAQRAHVALRVRDPLNFGMNQIALAAAQAPLNVALTTLDHFLIERRIQSLHLLKIDVEGYEYEVLKGARLSLKLYRPILFVEIDDHNLRHFGTTPDELIKFLSEIGYSYFSKNSVGIPLDPVLSSCHFDLIAQ